MADKLRKIDAVFNYSKQKYFTFKGVETPEEDTWDFPCNLCHGPATYRTCDVYFEYYDCLNCGNQVKVN